MQEGSRHVKKAKRRIASMKEVIVSLLGPMVADMYKKQSSIGE